LEATPSYVVGQWLHGAVTAGARPLLRALLQGGASPAAWVDPEDGSTLLMLGARLGRPELVADLLDAGAPVEEIDPEEGWNALCSAAAAVQVEVVRLLLERGARADDEAACSPALAAAEAG